MPFLRARLASTGGDRLLPLMQRVRVLAEQHLQGAFDDLEVLVVGLVEVGTIPAAGGDLDLDEREPAPGLLARLEEGCVVLLDRVVVPASLGGLGCFSFVVRAPPYSCASHIRLSATSRAPSRFSAQMKPVTKSNPV
jgi:hypothetical protein